MAKDDKDNDKGSKFKFASMKNKSTTNKRKIKTMDTELKRQAISPDLMKEPNRYPVVHNFDSYRISLTYPVLFDDDTGRISHSSLRISKDNTLNVPGKYHKDIGVGTLDNSLMNLMMFNKCLKGMRPWHRNGDDDVVDSVVGCRRGGCDDSGGVDVVTWVEVVVLVWGGSGGDGGDNGMAVVASGGE
ncbi:hypothetical protein Tco_1114002 [Tanacetum coccineum]|uniref:Uncharacterized protein n=1 Tax=Tanacetum coccineum TaxID=301880 RepID=A0ABQ5IU16_9ASTR